MPPANIPDLAQVRPLGTHAQNSRESHSRFCLCCAGGAVIPLQQWPGGAGVSFARAARSETKHSNMNRNKTKIVGALLLLLCGQGAGITVQNLYNGQASVTVSNERITASQTLDQGRPRVYYTVIRELRVFPIQRGAVPGGGQRTGRPHAHGDRGSEHHRQ